MNAIVMMVLSVIVLIGFNGPVCADSNAEGILRSVFYRKVWAVSKPKKEIKI